MANKEAKPKTLPPEKCYLRYLDGRPYGQGAFVEYDEETVRRTLDPKKLGDLQYSHDGTHWFTAKRLDPSIKFDVFISCSSDDYDKAERLREKLHRQKVKAFVAKKDMLYADDWQRSLQNAINNSLVLVLLLSENVYTRPDQVNREVAFAEKKKKMIVPFLMDDAPVPDEFEWMLPRNQKVVAKNEPWEGKIDKAIESIFAALGAPEFSQHLPGPIRRLWRDVRRAALTWSRKVTLFVVALVVCIGLIIGTLGWIYRNNLYEWCHGLFPQKPNPPTVKVETPVAVVVEPGKWEHVYRRDSESDAIRSYAPSESPPATAERDPLPNCCEFARELLHLSFSGEAVPFREPLARRAPPAAISSPLLQQTFDKLPGLEPDGQWFLQCSTVDPKNAGLRRQALVLTALGSALEPAFGKVDDNPNHATSWLIVHIDRNRCLVVWYGNSSSGNNYTQWPKDTKLADANRSRLAESAAQQDEKVAGILSNDIVVFCGEVPALAVRSHVQESRLASRNGQTHYDRLSPVDHLPWLLYFQVPKNVKDAEHVKAAFDKQVTYTNLKKDTCLLLPDLKDGQGNEYLEAIEKGRLRLLDIIDALEIGQRGRRVLIAPFVF